MALTIPPRSTMSLKARHRTVARSRREADEVDVSGRDRPPGAADFRGKPYSRLPIHTTGVPRGDT